MVKELFSYFLNISILIVVWLKILGIIRSIVPSLWVLRKVRLNLLVIEILFLMFGL